MTNANDFVGKILAFEEPYSTSGFILPTGTLIQRGLTLTEVSGPDASVAADEVGYYFSSDEENTVELVLSGRVAGGGASNLDYEELPPDLLQQIIAFDETISVPRQLVSIRPGLDAGLVRKISELLIGLELTEEGRQILDGIKQTTKFDVLPPETTASLQGLRELISLLAQ